MKQRERNEGLKLIFWMEITACALVLSGVAFLAVNSQQKAHAAEPRQLGACCLGAGSCMTSTLDECTEAGGLWLKGVACDDSSDDESPCDLVPGWD